MDSALCIAHHGKRTTARSIALLITGRLLIVTAVQQSGLLPAEALLSAEMKRSGHQCQLPTVGEHHARRNQEDDAAKTGGKGGGSQDP